ALAASCRKRRRGGSMAFLAERAARNELACAAAAQWMQSTLRKSFAAQVSSPRAAALGQVCQPARGYEQRPLRHGFCARSTEPPAAAGCSPIPEQCLRLGRWRNKPRGGAANVDTATMRIMMSAPEKDARAMRTKLDGLAASASRGGHSPQ